MRLELTNVKKEYNAKAVLDIDRLLLEKGRIYAVLGPNGSGKSTMLRIMAGFDRDFSGSVCYNDVDKQDNDIAYMPQNVYMFDLTVMENVKLGIEKSRDKSTGIENRVEHALASVGMSGFKNAKARSLSGGEAQRVALARTLILGRSLVFLDEPASATDILGIELVEKYITAFNKNDGATIVMTTHNPSQAARIADRVIMMHGGRVIETGSPENVLTNPQRQETKDFLRNWRI